MLRIYLLPSSCIVVRGSQEGLKSPSTRSTRRDSKQTLALDADSETSSRSAEDDRGLGSLLPQLARNASLLEHNNWLGSPIVPNADYSEHLVSSRETGLRRGIIASSAAHDSSHGVAGQSSGHLPDGISGVPIHSDVYIAPHKLQHAIYEARRRYKLFNDKLLSREPESPAQHDLLDLLCTDRMSKYTNVWTSQEKISLFYKDAERKALDLITKLNGNASGTGTCSTGNIASLQPCLVHMNPLSGSQFRLLHVDFFLFGKLLHIAFLPYSDQLDLSFSSSSAAT